MTVAVSSLASNSVFSIAGPSPDMNSTMRTLFWSVSAAQRAIYNIAKIAAIIVTTLALLNSANADDAELFDLSSCDIGEKYRFVFIVDNSGSMDNSEFTQSRSTINEDHQPASLAAMRRDNVYGPGGALDITDGTNVQFVFFTDAWRDYSGGCCSSIVADYRGFIPADVKPGFGEYDALKDGSVLPRGLEAQFTLLHVAPNNEARRAGAQIASASLSRGYTGAIENNPSDPDDNALPRRYIEGSLSSRDTSLILELIREVIEEIRFPASFAAPAVSVSAFNDTRHRDELYYSFFQPGVRARWAGNVKKYRLRADGLTVDRFNNPIVDADTGLLADSSVSFWSATPDGAEVQDGGFAAKQPAVRNWFSDINADGSIAAIDRPNQIPANLLGAASNAERNRLVNWARGADVQDENDNGSTNDAHHFVADSMHNSPLLLNYSARGSELVDVIFSANNLGTLHAIDAAEGTELWSYTPASMLRNIKPYFENASQVRQWGLDGPMMVYSEQADDPAYDRLLYKAWLYLAERRGGNRIHALDVTNGHQTFNPVEKLWTIQGGSGDFMDLAQTWSAMDYMDVTVGCSDECRRETVMLFSGGYNPIYDDENLGYPVSAPGTGHGNAIYMVDLQTGERLWSAGNGAHHDLNIPISDSVPSAPVPLDTDADGDVDLIYFVDIAGNVWRVDLDPFAESFSQLHIGGGKIAALNPPTQTSRFFNSLNVVRKGTTAGVSHLNLIIGSGNRARPLFDEVGENRIYVVRDEAVWNYPTGEATDPLTGRYLPEYRYVRASDGSRSIITLNDLADMDASATVSPKYGSYRRLPEIGEKILQPTLTTSGVIFMLSYVPPDASSDDTSCTYKMGSSRLYLLDLDTLEFLVSPLSDEIYIDMGWAIAPEGRLIDTGDGGIKYTSQFGKSLNLGETLPPPRAVVFRRFYRTGWVEKDGYH